MTIRELYNNILDKYPQYTDYIDCSSGDIEFFLSPISEYHYADESFCRIQYYTNTTYMARVSLLTKNNFKNPELTECKGLFKLVDGLTPEEIYDCIKGFLPRYEVAIEWFDSIMPQIQELPSYLFSLGFKGNGYKNNHSAYILDMGDDQPLVRLDIPNLDNLGFRIEVLDPQFNHLLDYSDRDFNKCIEKVIE